MRALVVGGYGFCICDETRTITWQAKRFVAPNVVHLQRFIRGRCYMNFCQARELCAAWTSLEHDILNLIHSLEPMLTAAGPMRELERAALAHDALQQLLNFLCYTG